MVLLDNFLKDVCVFWENMSTLLQVVVFGEANAHTRHIKAFNICIYLSFIELIIPL